MSSPQKSISDKLNHQMRLSSIKEAIKLNMFSLVRDHSKDLDLSKEGPDLLVLCVIYGALESLNLLIKERGVDPNALDSDGQTVLHVASRIAHYNASLDVVHLLLNNYKVNPNTPNAEGRTAWQEYPKVFSRVTEIMVNFLDRNFNQISNPLSTKSSFSSK